MIKSLPFLHQHPLQILHLAGKRDESLMAENYSRENILSYVAAFHHRMEELYSAADLVIARSGAASLAEIAAFGLPAILIPFPYAAEDHQTRNAEIFARGGAAVLMKESDLSGESLARHINDLIGNDGALIQMAEKSANLAHKDAAAAVATTVEKISSQ
jgi:UDP-N-acetylglucosamine--N-acetylmuramyl-(pentapeptide) pyrophosphoryl-undecaprenol N-acetylglucosamine transferase